jgi:hypothetical protein
MFNTNLKAALTHGHVIKNSKIPKMLSWVITIRAITIYPFIIFRDEPDEQTVSHERIHIAQQRELWVIPFYVLYIGHWLINKFRYSDSGPEAYYNIPFEQEAYKNSSNNIYLLDRPKHAWKNYSIDRAL